MLLAAALALAPASTATQSPSQLAIQAFREACIQGSFRLSPDRGQIVAEKDMPDLAAIWEPLRPTASRMVIRLTAPPSTYLVFVEYKHTQPGSIARSCDLVSKSVPRREAMAAFLEGLPERDVRPTWVPDMYLPLWTSDHPELGYRKQLWFNDQAFKLQIGLYPSAAAQMNEGTKKQ